MVRTIEAVFDGKALLPESPLALEPNTRVRITIESVEKTAGNTTSFLRTARSLQLDGPPDWSGNLKTYLYGGEHRQTISGQGRKNEVHSLPGRDEAGNDPLPR